FEENQHARRVDEFLRLRTFLEPGQKQTGGAHPVAADFSENVLERLRAGSFQRRGLQFLDVRLFLGSAAEEGQKRGVLEQQITARGIAAAMLPGEMQRVGAGDS